MWIIVLSIFAFTRGAFGEVDCSLDPFLECEKPELLAYIPKEISEYNRLCPKVLAFLRCLKEFQEKCEEVVFSSEEYYNGTYGVFTDLCEEGTALNKVVQDNLLCFNKTFAATSCPEKTKAVTGPYRTVENNTEGDYEYSLPIELMCLEDILDSSCISADIGQKCGQVALQATSEFLRRTLYIEENCGVYSAKKLLHHLYVFPLDKAQREIIITTLDSISKSNDTFI